MSVSATSTAGAAPESRRISHRGVLLVASFGALLAFLDATIVNVAFPSIRLSFPGSSIGALSWVLNAYNIVFAALLVAAGRFADLFGRRRMFTSGIVLFTLASGLCAASSSLSLLIAARAFQAVGAALLVPASLALVVDAFPASRRGHAVGIWGATAAAAAGLGPPLGGALVEADSWRLVFLINLPLGAVAVALAGRFIVESRAPGRRAFPDTRGALLQATAIALATLGIVEGNSWGWASVGILAAFSGALVTAAFSVQSSRRHPVPVLDPELLRIRSFAVANAVTFVAGMGFYAYLLNNILWLNYVWDWSLLYAGLAVAPGAIVAAVVAARLGPIADLRGYRIVAVPGALVWAGAYVWYATRVGTAPNFLSQWLPGQILSGIGVGATLPIVGSAALGAVPGARYATASSVVSSARQLGGVVGIALLVVIVGTPTATTFATGLRHGWIFTAACFVVAAGGAMLLRPQRGTIAEAEVAELIPKVEIGPATARAPHRAYNADSLLQHLPERLRTQLLTAAQTVSVPAGEWLFELAGPADALYVLLAGRLDVVGPGGELLRELGPGDVVGELAVLAGGIRSAGVRARRDSRLARIGANEFRNLVDIDAEGRRALVTALATQLQRSRGLDNTTNASEPRVLSLLGVGAGAPLEEVRALLTEELAGYLRIVAPGRVGLDGLDRAERDYDRVLLAASDDDGEWRAFCVRQSDRIVVVARTDQPPPRLASERPSYVLLVGAPPTRLNLLAWHDTLGPRHLYASPEADLQRAVASLAARLAGRSLGVALAGGGARSLAAIGVLHELEAAGAEVDRIAGCSLGGVVAALHASGNTATAIDAICYEEFVRRNPFRDFTLPRVSISRGRKAEAALERRFGDTHFEELPRQLALVSTDMLDNAIAIHRRGVVRDALRASLSLPGLFPPARLRDSLHIDGGILDNLPVKSLNPDEGPILAVNIAAAASSRRHGGPPRMPNLPETMMRAMLMGTAAAVTAARKQATVVVTPDTRGIGLLEFHQIDRAIEAGRAAGRAALEALQAAAIHPGLRDDLNERLVAQAAEIRSLRALLR